MADFGKINPEKAQAIINALKDGKINPSEMKQLGLTAEEAKALNEAFSSGQVEIGDFVLINKGKVTKDGKELQLSSTQKKPKHAEQESVFMAKAKTVGKYVGAAVVAAGAVAGGVALATGAAATLPAWAPIAMIVAGGALLTGCAPENKVEAHQSQNMNIKMQDYSKQLDQIIQRLDKIDNGIANQYKTFLAKLQTIIDNQNATQATIEFQLNNLMDQMKDWFQQIVNNQVAIRTDNNKNAADILAAIQAIIDNKDNVDTKLDELIKLLNQIKTVSEDILTEVKKAKEEIKVTLNTNNKAVLDAIAKLNDNDQKTLSVLNDIKALINKYGEDGKQLGEQILIAIGNISGNVDLTEVLKLLEKLVNGQKVTNDGIANMTNVLGEFKAKNKEQLDVVISKLDKINATLEKLGVDVSVGMNAILNAIKDLPDFSGKLDEIIKRMDDLNGKVTKNGNTLVEILDAIKKLQNTINIVIEGDKIKVKCNCGDCGGGKHEGIIGDLNDLLG